MHKITTSIAYATQEQQWVKECIVPRGASVIDLIEQSVTADPKEVRRQLALLGKTIGKKSS